MTAIDLDPQPWFNPTTGARYTAEQSGCVYQPRTMSLIQQRILKMQAQLALVEVGGLILVDYPGRIRDGKHTEVWLKVDADAFRRSDDWPEWSTAALASVFHTIQPITPSIANTLGVAIKTAAAVNQQRMLELGE